MTALATKQDENEIKIPVYHEENDPLKCMNKPCNQRRYFLEENGKYL